MSSEIIVVVIRLLSALLILRYPLLGGFIVIGIDYIDFELIRFLNGGDLENYQKLDKSLDMFYLSIEAYIASRWQNRIVAKTALFLFFYRFVGFFIFLGVEKNWILLIFPNLFEPLYLIHLSLQKIFGKDLLKSVKVLIVVLFLLLIPKLIHEYFLHINTTHPWTENKYLKLLLSNNLFIIKN